MDIGISLLLFAAAAMGGAMNAVAGGGTFLTFPVLIFSGFSASQANIISTLALWPGSVSSAVAYRAEWREHKHILPPLMLVSLIGGAVGAITFLNTPEVTFQTLVPWLLLVATLIFTFGRRVIGWFNRHSTQTADAPSPARRVATRLMQFTIAAYGGYFGAGIGILMLAMLQLMGFTQIHTMNALKTMLGSAINAVAGMIFLLLANIPWPMTLVMIAGGVTGGYAGARLALRVRPEVMRLLISIIGFAMTGVFFFAR